MTAFFANSLIDGLRNSSLMGQIIVAIQLLASVFMVAIAIGKWKGLSRELQASRRVTRDVMGGRDVMDYYLARHPNGHSPLENIYWATCERLLRLLAPDVRSLLVGRQPGVEVALTAHEMGLVKALSEHVLDEEEIRVEHGMGAIATVVALAPMLGLLGTVWGVLDAFADMGEAGSATIATMAPAISSAIVTTVVGLLVAIPGVIMHTRLNATVRALMSDMEGFTDDLTGRIALEFQGRAS
jgi:biopolymer transport protein ExbB/TolQ